MAKKSGGGALGGILLVGLALLATVPKEVWLTIGFLALVVGAIYLFAGQKRQSAANDRQDGSREHDPRASGQNSRAPRQVRNHTEGWSGGDEPVRITAGGPERSYGVPKAPPGRGQARWVAAGEPVTVAGTNIPDGMLYVGSKLATPYGGNDPALIDPGLSVARHGDYTQRGFGYWPSYSEIPPAARRAYLDWLAGGRKDPKADIGYVFLFFYGLERRAIVEARKDTTSQADWPRIADELRRLLAIYGNNNSFNGYATKLLSWVSLTTFSTKLYLEPLPEYEANWEVPLHLRLVLGQCAIDQMPLPAHIALAWARHEPNIPFRTPAIRCGEQFSDLFKRKYQEQFGEGLQLPVNKTKLKFVYSPASAGFRGYNEINLTFGDVPDVTVLTGPIKKLRDVVEAATKELESYSRFVGRNPTQTASLDALLLLPATLWPETIQVKLRELKAQGASGLLRPKRRA